MMLILLILGPKQPSLAIDVFQKPLINDLNTIWDEGINVYDAYKDECFTSRVMLLWIVNGFSSYGNLSRHATYRYKTFSIRSDEACL